MVKTLFSSPNRQLIAAVVDARKQAGLTQRQLADRLGKPQNYVGRVETEQRRLDFIELLAWFKACGVDAEEAVLALTRKIGGGPGRNTRSLKRPS